MLVSVGFDVVEEVVVVKIELENSFAAAFVRIVGGFEVGEDKTSNKFRLSFGSYFSLINSNRFES